MKAHITQKKNNLTCHMCYYNLIFVGTREGKATVSEEEDFYKQFVNFLSKICKCCQKQDKSETKQTKRGSLAEGRTNISVELGNSSSKVNNNRIIINNAYFLSIEDMLTTRLLWFVTPQQLHISLQLSSILSLKTKLRQRVQ